MIKSIPVRFTKEMKTASAVKTKRILSLMVAVGSE